jgi:cytoskeletal protein CcmA (bactofilin family)
VQGAVLGRISGFAVRLTATARVEGDILQRSLAIEGGARFEGAVRRLEAASPAPAGRVA